MNMKKSSIRLLIIILVVSLILVGSIAISVVSCKDNKPDSSADGDSVKQPDISLTLSDKSVSILLGEAYLITADYTETENRVLTWESADDKVATVEDGLVTAVGGGTTKITATYGDKKAECEVSVSFADYMPELKIRHITEDGVRVSLNSAFDIDAYILFNGREYACDFEAEVANGDILSCNGGALTAKAIGSTTVTVKTKWNGFDNALTEKTFGVEVFNDVNINAMVAVNGDARAVKTLDLSITPSFAGENFATTADVEFVVKENGVKSVIEGSIVSGNDVVTFENGVVTAIALGNAVISATYTDELGNDYSCELKVNVTVPVCDYNDKIELCAENAFPLEQYFGEGATIVSVTSDGKAVDFDEKGVIALIAKGEDTQGFEILTTKGGYRFNNVFAYTRKVTSANFVNTFSLVYDKPIDGYYILGEDITGINSGSYQTMPGGGNTYFKGVLDGRGYTVNATVSANGLFGALAGDAVIKNAKFVLTFPDGEACGFAKNQGTFNQNNADKLSSVTLKNLYIETTNYYAKSTVIMDQKPDKLHMFDVYVKINGNAALGEYTEASSLRRALFRHDQSMNDGQYECFNGYVKRVYVVTETFIPIANGVNWQNKNFITYAKNDQDKLGLFTRENQNNGAFNYFKIRNANEEGSAESKLFGYDNGQKEYFTYIYGAHFNHKDGGIERYDTVEELKATGVTTVGTWTIE